MAPLAAFLGPLIRLGLLSLLASLVTSADPAWHPPRPLDVQVVTADASGDGASGHPQVLVGGKPFFPIGITYHFTLHRDSWDEDLEGMRGLGLNTVRIDLGWRDIEPLAPGRYRFGPLDEFLDTAYRHGMYVVPVFSHTTQDFNTPLWFWAMYRDWRVVDQNGQSPLDDLPCLDHPDYRGRLRDYIEATVSHIKGHPAVLAYQVLNEPRYGMTELYDYNPYSISAFRQWLLQKYGSLDQLNRAWSTTYGSIDEVEPWRGSGNQLPTQGPLLRQWSDWRSFGYDDLSSFVGEMARAIKEADPNHPVIVSEMAWWWWGQQPLTGVSPLHIYQDADIVGFDLYPDSIGDASYYSLTADMLARYWRRPVWVMEMNRKDGAPTGEDTHAFAASALSGGASGVFYFQWRDDPSDGGNYGVVDARGRRKPQYGGLASTVRWLRDNGGLAASAAPAPPDLYLVWPSEAVSEISGDHSPAWDIYKTARRIADGGLRIGLVAEELIHAVDPSKLLILRNGQLEIGKGSSEGTPPRTSGLLLSDDR